MFDEDISPDSTVFGSGEPRSAVVGSIHGDEPTGVRAIHRVLETAPTFAQAAKFIVANPPAAVAHRRYLDEDMNRVFPGDPDADARERRLAAQLVAETAGVPTLSVHTTHATPDPMAFITSGNPRALEIADQLPTEYVVNEQPVVDNAFSSTNGVISVVAGKPEQHSATEKAVRIIEAFLRITDVVDKAAETDSNTQFFTSDGTVEKPPNAKSYELLVENFRRVKRVHPTPRQKRRRSPLTSRSSRSSYPMPATTVSSGTRAAKSLIRSMRHGCMARRGVSIEQVQAARK